MGWKDSATPVAAGGSWRDRSEAIALTGQTDKKSEIANAIKKITSGNSDKIAGLMNGRFGDTGRAASSPGEYLDAIAGAPVRTALYEGAAKGQGLVPSIKAGASSIMKDPANAPSGVDIAADSGIKNPYAGAALGTLIDVGAQLPLAEGLNAGSKALSSGSKYLGTALKDIAESRAFKALGPTKRFEDANQAKGLVNSIGRTALDEGVVSPLASKKTMLSRAQQLEGRKEGELSGLLKDVSAGEGLAPDQRAALDLEGSRFNPQVAAEELKGKFLEQNDQLPAEVTTPRLSQYDQWLGGKGPMNADEAQRFKLQMQKFIKDPSYWKSNPNASQQGLMDIRNAIKSGIESDADAYAKAVGKDTGAMKGVNRELGNSYEMQNILEDRISRNGANRTISPSDYIGGLMGEHALGPVGLLAAPVHKFAREKGSQLMATGADALSKLLLESPTMRTLAEKDPDAFTNAVSTLSRQLSIERNPPMAAEQEKPKGFINAQ